MALYITEDEVQRLLPIKKAVAAVEEAMRQQGLGMAVNRPRQRVRTPAGTLHMMGAAVVRSAGVPYVEVEIRRMSAVLGLYSRFQGISLLIPVDTVLILH